MKQSRNYDTIESKYAFIIVFDLISKGNMHFYVSDVFRIKSLTKENLDNITDYAFLKYQTHLHNISFGSVSGTITTVVQQFDTYQGAVSKGKISLIRIVKLIFIAVKNSSEM